MKKFVNLPLNKFISELSLKTAAPGGGSTSAAAAAMGISLLSMAANFSVNKTGDEKNNTEIVKIITKLSEYQTDALALVDLDAEMYGLVAKALKLPKNNQGEINIRNRRLQSALMNSLSVPVSVFEISCNVIPYAERLVKIGNKNLISDVYCGLSMLKAAIETSEFNMDANIKYISDSKFKNNFSKKYVTAVKKSVTRIGKIINNL